jgi:hypothetical protein
MEPGLREENALLQNLEAFRDFFLSFQGEKKMPSRALTG